MNVLRARKDKRQRINMVSFERERGGEQEVTDQTEAPHTSVVNEGPALFSESDHAPLQLPLFALRDVFFGQTRDNVDVAIRMCMTIAIAVTVPVRMRMSVSFAIAIPFDVFSPVPVPVSVSVSVRLSSKSLSVHFVHQVASKLPTRERLADP